MSDAGTDPDNTARVTLDFAGARQAETARALLKFLSTPAAARVIKAEDVESG